MYLISIDYFKCFLLQSFSGYNMDFFFLLIILFITKKDQK